MAEPEPTVPQETRDASSKTGVLSPDFLVFALPFALIIDVLDFVFDIGTVFSLLLGIPLVLWMVWREGRIKDAGAEIREIAQKRDEYVAHRKAAKTGAKKVARQGGRRVLRRALFIYVAEAIPIVNLIPFWLISTVRTGQKT
ncbi:MAG: hypothetical protein ABIB12_01730 [Patescibacteria group bacterium]